MEVISSIRTRLGIMAIVILLPLYSFAQEEDLFGIERKISGRKSKSNVGNVFRNAVSTFSIEISSGAGLHTNQLDFATEVPSSYPIYSLSDQVSAENHGEYQVQDRGFPVNAGIKLRIYNLLTLGGGYAREFGTIRDFELADQRFQIEQNSYSFDRLYGAVGLILYNAERRAAYLQWKYRKYSGSNYYMQSQLRQRIRQAYPWNFILEGEFGSLKINQTYDSHLRATEPFYSLGLKIEREFSDYARIFVKPSANFYKLSYEKSVTVGGIANLETHPIQQNFYTLNVGLSLSIPGTKRCKVSGCGVVMKHLHDGVEYRGSSIWKRQNRKVGQWYK